MCDRCCLFMCIPCCFIYKVIIEWCIGCCMICGNHHYDDAIREDRIHPTNEIKN